jgi:hypothetical protein
MKVKVIRFDLYPKNDANSYVISFEVTLDNNKILYKTTRLTFDDVGYKNEDEIVQLAWNNIKDNIVEENKIKNKSNILNITFCVNDDYELIENTQENDIISPDIFTDTTNNE